MGVWVDTDDKTKCGVVISAFESTDARKLQLYIGDAVLLLKECQDWYYGCNIRSQNIRGIFPKSYVHIKEVNIIQSGTVVLVAAKDLPIVNEMTAVLREWGKIWKKLYVMHRAPGSAEEKKFRDLRSDILKVMEGRKKIMSRKLTVDELKATQQKYSNIIDIGNAKLGLDLVVRDDEGNTLDPQSTSTIKLFRQHEVATKRIDRMLKGISSDQDEVKSQSFNMWVNVKAFVCNVTEMSEVYVSLYDPTANCFFTESYLCKYGDKGLPRDIEMLNQMKALFTDLGQKDLARERIFIICQVIRFGRMSINEPEHRKETHNLRRPFGIAACDITHILKSPDTDEKPLVAPFQPCGEKESLDSVIRKAVSGKDGNHKDQALHLVIRKVLGSMPQVKKKSPNLVAPPTVIARKLGFPDVIMPDDVRNDLYVTLIQGEFKRSSTAQFKSSEKNIEVTMSVCNQHGKVLENVIFEGVGGAMISEYRSVTYYHEDKPKWCETVKIGIPINDFYGSHLKFTFKHRSSNDEKDKKEKPFALSYVRLMHDNGTVTADGIHSLLVFKIDSKKFDDSPVYLKMPSKQKEIDNKPMIGHAAPTGKQLQIQSGPFSWNMADSFQIQTLLCSTKLTHDVDLMGLLKWRDTPANLQQNLFAFMRVDGAEVVKFLPDVLDSLFNIVVENSDSDTYDAAVFSALIYVVGLVSDVKYHQFKSVMDLYIKENFSATLAYNKLIVVLKERLESFTDMSKSDDLLKTMNSLQYIFKFINGSRRLFARMNEQRGKQQFEMGMTEVFRVLNTVMSKTSAQRLYLIQQACLRHLPSALSDIMTVYPPAELSFMLMELMKAIPKAHMTREKLNFILELIRSDLFKLPDCRRVMLNQIMTQLKMLLQKNDQIDMCFTILSELMDILHTEGRHEDISTVMNTMLRTVSQTISHLLSPPAPALSMGVAVLTAILRQMSDEHYNQYLASFETGLDLEDFLMEILMGFKHMILKGVYPKDWCMMILLQNSVFLQALRHFSTTIRGSFVSPFNFQIWDTFFQCAITFISQEALELHKFSTAKRNKIINRYGDMRRDAGHEVRNLWYSLSYNKVQFIPHLVELILQMTLIPQTELRESTLPLFYDMMYCEYVSQAASRTSARSGFAKFEKELITQLDRHIAELGKGDIEYRQLFYTTLQGLCQESDRIQRDGFTFVEMVADLLMRLLEYRDVINSENIDSKMSCTVDLLNFYEEIDRIELYVKYVHILCELHVQCDNFTEAAHTKMLYAKLLQWSDDEVPVSLLSPYDKPGKSAKTQRELKMKTYFEIIDYLDRGKMWEKGIEFCKELVTQYETQLFDYIALAKILRRQAEFYTSIMETNHPRPKPEYFRVAYYGTGFPSFLRNKEFVYRGKDYEKLGEFSSRMQCLYTNASLMRTLNPPTEEMKSSPQQYLQINSVNPVLDLKDHLKKKKLNEQILKYYRVNEVEKFVYSKKKVEGDNPNDLTALWLEKIYVTITQPLPGVLRWFPVNSTSVVEVSPLENALETMSGTNEKIQALIDAFEANKSVRVDQLSMVLNGVVDAAVNGGIANYKLFYSPEYFDDHPNHRHLVTQLKDATSLQLLLLNLGLDIHRKNAPESLMPFQAHLDQRFAEMKNSIEQDYGIKLTKDSQEKIARQHNIALKRIMSMKPRQGSPGRSPLKGVHSTQRSQSMLTPAKTQVPKSDGKTKVFTRAGTTAGRSPRASVASTASQQAAQDATGSHSPSLPRMSVVTEGDRKVVEITEELTSSRPRRPTSGRPDSRPSSGQYSNPGDLQHLGASQLSLSSLGSSAGSISMSSLNRLSNDFGDAPPPLPVKHSVSVVSTESLGPGDSGTLKAEKHHPVLHEKGSTYEVPPLPGKGEGPPVLPDKHTSPRPPRNVPPAASGDVPLLPDKGLQRPKPARLNMPRSNSPPPLLPPKHSTASEDGSTPAVPPRSPYTPNKPLVLPPSPASGDGSGESDSSFQGRKSGDSGHLDISQGEDGTKTPTNEPEVNFEKKEKNLL